jgi:vitamin B12 transporter
MRLLIATTCFCALAALPPGHAQQAPAPDAAGAEAAAAVSDVVRVTAARSPRPAETSPASTATLDRAAVERLQAIGVAEALATTPGVNFTRNGGIGAATTVNIRGAEGHHTVVLIDGVKLNDPSSTQGGFNFGNLLIGDVARIEALRGPQSTLWGSQAIGGVVNVITAAPTEPFELLASAEAGSRGTGQARIAAGGRSGRTSWRLAGGQFVTDGFSARSGGAEDDGYVNTGASGRLLHDVSDAVSVEGRVVWSEGRLEFDGFFGDSPEEGDTTELVAYAGVNADLADGRLRNRFAVTLTDTERRNFNPASAVAPVTFEAEGRNERAEYQGSLAIATGWTAAVGAETERSEYSARAPSSFAPNPPRRGGDAGVDSLYALIEGEALPGLTLSAGVRGESHDAYGEQTLGQAGLAFAPGDGATVFRAAFGEGFRAPGLFELFSEFGNAALEPEEAASWEAGVERRFGERARAGATWFRREVENEIRFFSCPFGAPSADPLCAPGGVPRFGYYRNVQETEAEGVELEGEAELGAGLSVAGNYTWTDATNASGPNAGRRLVRRPEHLANLSLTWRSPGGLTLTAAARHVGDSFTNEANTGRLDGYTLLDLRVAAPLGDSVEVFGRIENATDEEYETVQGFGTPGLGVFAGVRVRR